MTIAFSFVMVVLRFALEAFIFSVVFVLAADARCVANKMATSVKQQARNNVFYLFSFGP